MDQMGIIGYFPATVVKETQRFTENTVKIQTTVSTLNSFMQHFFLKRMNTFFPHSMLGSRT